MTFFLFFLSKNNPTILTHSFAVKPDTYFYPASTIKLPIGVLALEKLNQIEAIDRDTPLIIFTEENTLNGVRRKITRTNNLFILFKTKPLIQIDFCLI